MDLNQGRIKAMHLVGSNKSQWYFDLSFIYCRACDSCPDLDGSRFEFSYAFVHVDGTWSFPSTLSEEDVETAPRMPLPAALVKIETISPDVMVPHMFCVDGMTRYRSLFSLMQIPFLGNPDYSVWPSTDKATTKMLLAGAGVQVPKGELLIKGEKEKRTVVKTPCVVKPANEDNSIGITLVRREEDFDAALEYAFGFDARVVVDEYIAGRELRAACVENEDGSLTVLPLLEYFLDDIRTSAHKLQNDDKGGLSKNAIMAAKKENDRQCPADVSPQLLARVEYNVKEAHKALRSRHYSIFDIRVDADEQPFLLEACPFCSFSPLSVIPSMASKCDIEHLKHPHFFHSLLERTAAEKAKKGGGFATCASTEASDGCPASDGSSSEGAVESN